MFALKLSIAFFILKASCTYMPGLLIDLQRTSVFMLLPSYPSRFTEWLRSSSWSLGWIICLTNWSGGSIQHLPSCSTVTTRTVTVARWAGTLTADARSGCFKTCLWPFEISFFESRAETKSHSLCTPITGSHLGEGSDPHPPPPQESLWRPSSSLPLFIHLQAGPLTPLQGSRVFLIVLFPILIDIPNIRFASQNHASSWPLKRTLGSFFFCFFFFLRVKGSCLPGFHHSALKSPERGV